MPIINLHHAQSSDYEPIIAVLNDWWGGRAMRDMLPRLFFTHFQPTSFVAKVDDERVGFLIGFISQTAPEEAYIHFVGVHPDYRKDGVGRALYERFFKSVRAKGCASVGCVTSPVNKTSIAFHLSMGFQPKAGDTEINGIAVHRDYDGAGEDRVVFVKMLA